MTTTSLTDAEMVAIQRKVVAEHLAGENEHDYAKVNATFVQADRSYYEIAAGGAHFDGPAGVSGFYQLLDSVLPDLDVICTHEYDVPGCSIREVTARGTHSAEFAGVPASGNYVSFEVAAFYIFDLEEPDKLVAERAYWDNDGLIRQLKGEPVPSLGLVENPRR